MKQNKTKIIMIVDCSGSMRRLMSSTLKACNSLKKEQAQEPGECDFRLVSFSSKVQTVIPEQDINLIDEIDVGMVHCEGLTALHDAIGSTIDSVGTELAEMPEDERPEHVIFAIQTDGSENASRDYNLRSVNKMITLQQDKYNWKFLFLGAGIDAMSIGTKLGFAPENTLSYEASAVGTAETYNQVSRSFKQIRSSSK